MATGRRVLASLSCLSVVLGAVVALLWAQSASSTAAAHLQGFDPGNIITDGVFYDTSTMSVADIQRFMDSKGGRCTAGALCLKNYVETTNTRPADTRCLQPYNGAASESAATIVFKVAQACGINPQVLLVTLQKEQGLVTATSPTAGKYRIAMGYGCPDTAACDTKYYGFFNQLYSAARQFQNYRATPTRYSYRAGLTNTISYYPATESGANVGNWRCGTASVLLRNQATAGLYNYTPYVPNRAAMEAGYGGGDACSSYGNRNFYNYFTDWFGSTQTSAGSQIVEKYQATGGGSGVLGAATTPINCGLVDGGCWQGYVNGSIYWSPATGAHFVKGAILALYAQHGWERGSLGYPIRDEHNLDGGTYSMFANGSIYWSPVTGTHIVRGAVLSKWHTVGSENGALGWPTAGEICVKGGCFGQFQRGSIYWSPVTGTHIVKGAIFSKWGARGWETGVLGWPTADETCVPGGCYSTFQGGGVYWTPSSGAVLVKGAIRDRWSEQRGVTGALGWPTADETCVPGGCYSTFQGGALLWSPQGGVRGMDAPFHSGFTAAGGVRKWGFPTTDQTPLVDGAFAVLAGDQAVYSSEASGVHVVKGAIRARWAALGQEAGPLRYPTSDEVCVPGGCYTDFQGGILSWSPATGVRLVKGAIAQAWTATGRERGSLGFPTADELCTSSGCYSTFQHGSISWSPTTGARYVKGAIHTSWVAAGRERGHLGFPTSDEICVPGGCYTTFERGSLSWSPSTGVQMVGDGPIYQAWVASGREAGSLGFPTAAGTCVTGGCWTTFQRGTVYDSEVGGVQTMSGPVLSAYLDEGGPAGSLGFPVGPVTTVHGGAQVEFAEYVLFVRTDDGAVSITRR